MKILMLVNWKVEYGSQIPKDKQPPDYYVTGQPYWFFRYFKGSVQADVLDIGSFPWLERLEKDKLRFYVIQALRAIPKLNRYDLIVSHGMQSGVVISLFRRLFKTKAKHIVFDIGSFNSGAETGKALKLMQFASRSIDGIIYHTSRQLEYYRRCFPWIVERAEFIPFGTDSVFFENQTSWEKSEGSPPYLLCVGYAKRDWPTLCAAFTQICQDLQETVQLKLIGKESIEELSVPEKIRERIVMRPYIPIGQLIEEIKGACICVVPLQSFLYSFGQMTLLQQMALGKAVIAAQVPSLTDYGRDGDTLLFYQPGNSEDLAHKIKELLSDGELRRRLGQAAAESVKRDYNEKKMAENIENFLERLID